jgi:S-formylglutathione hydrolase FrmB
MEGNIMAIIRWQFFSQILKLHTSLTLSLPEHIEPSAHLPILYLLHGGTENATTWLRETDLEAISKQFHLVTASIDGMSSAYVDMYHGGRYFTYLTQELPELLPSRFPVSSKPEDALICGFSMGGQGALRAAFRHPERYGACIAISGARDMIPLFEKWKAMKDGPDLSGVVDALGPIETLRGSENDIVNLAAKAVMNDKTLPKFYLACGNDDYAVELSDAYHQYLASIGLNHLYYKAPGIHNYDFAQQALVWALEQAQIGGVIK